MAIYHSWNIMELKIFSKKIMKIVEILNFIKNYKLLHNGNFYIESWLPQPQAIHDNSG